MKIKLITILSATIIILSIAVPSSVFGETPLFEVLELPKEFLILGRTEEVGTYFEIQDSEYLDVTLGSAEEIKVVLKSIPRMISLDIEVTNENANTTELIIGGLEPNKTYYKYQDSYKNEAVFISSESGSYNWVQGLSQPHHIWIQEIKGTIFISEDTVLDHDITGSVEITADNIILDCNGYSITGSDTGYGIYSNNKTGITITSCKMNSFSTGIYLYSSSYNILNNNIISNNWVGISLVRGSANNKISNNNVSNNKESSIYFGDYIYGSNSNMINNNNFSDNQGAGINISHSEYNIFTDNNISNNAHDGIVISISSFTVVANNLVLNNGGHGIYLDRSFGVVLKKNAFSYNGIDGISLWISQAQIEANVVEDNAYDGIKLWASGYYPGSNLVTSNTFSRNGGCGILLRSWSSYKASNNLIYHNNFTYNNQNVCDEAGGNFWDNSYPDGGNYWSDYTGVDFYKGSKQDQVGSDGMGDFPYIFTNGQDNYPFMKENGWEMPDLVFQPNKDGFEFQNFCPTYFDEEIGKEVTRTWDMFVQFFGKEATMLGEDTRRFTAEHFFEEEYAKYNSDSCGSCDGFSSASLINFEQLAQPNSGIFDMPFYSQLYPQSINDDIKEAIVYQQGFQFSKEVFWYLKQLEWESNFSPKFFYEKVKNVIDNKNSTVLWISEIPKDWEKWKKGGGHALVAYKYEEESSEDKAYVYVYDSNYSGDNNRILEFDLENDKWIYEFEKGWWIFGETWDGDISDSYLTIAVIPLDMRLNKGVPPWGQDISPYTYVCSVGEAVVPLFTNQNVQRIGFIDEEFVNEIPYALYFISPIQNQNGLSGLYYLPQEDEYTINFYGIEQDELDFSVYSNQSLIELTGAKINSDTIDAINIGRGNSSLIYSTNDDYKEYSVIITKEFPDVSRMVRVDTEIFAEDIITIEMTDEQSFKYVNTGDSKSYDLILEQRGAGAGYTSFSDLIIGDNDTHIIEVADWGDVGDTEIILEIDEDSNGSIDEKKTLQIIFEDPARGTKLIINTANKTFHFIAPGKDFGIIKADKMEIINPLSKRDNTLIKYRDEYINFTAIAISGDMDFCSASVRDKERREHYLLIDKIGKE